MPIFRPRQKPLLFCPKTVTILFKNSKGLYIETVRVFTQNSYCFKRKVLRFLTGRGYFCGLACYEARRGAARAALGAGGRKTRLPKQSAYAGCSSFFVSGETFLLLPCDVRAAAHGVAGERAFVCGQRKLCRLDKNALLLTH